MTDINPVVALLGLITALCTGGFFNVLLSTLSGRRTKKVDDLAKFGEMQQKFRDEVREDNAALNTRLDGVIKTLNTLTDAVDDFLILIAVLPTVPDDARRVLREANNEAKRAA